MKHPFDKALNLTEAQKVSKPAFGTVIKLTDLTNQGEQDAAAELFRLAAFVAEIPKQQCEANPEMFAPIAANQVAWPAMHSLHRGLVQKNDALLKNLKLASNTDINISEKGKAFSFDTPATRVALDHYRLARILRRAPIDEWSVDEWITVYTICDSSTPNRLRTWEAWGQSGSGKSLPPLSKNTSLQWKKAFPTFFRLVHGEDFDECAKLENLRDSVSQSSKDGSNNVGGRGTVRKRMLQAVTQAIDSIAAWNE